MCEVNKLANYGISKTACIKLAMNGINTVEQIKELYENDEYESVLGKIRFFGPKTREKIICAMIDCLDAEREENIPVDNGPAIIEEDPVDVEEFPQKENGTVDIAKVSSNIITKAELADYVINTAMDLIEESDTVEILNKSYDSKNCKDDKMFVSKQKIFVEKAYLEREFNNRVKNIHLDTGEERRKYFEIALANSGAVGKKFSFKTGIEFLYTRKSFSPSKKNYVEINIHDAENQVNRIFKNPYIDSEPEYNFIEEPTRFEPVKKGIIIVGPQKPEKAPEKLPEVKLPIMENNTTIVVTPIICDKAQKKDEGYILIFKVYEIDPLHFDIENSKAISGQYLFTLDDKENGEMMISGLFDKYEMIKKKVLEFIG